MTRKVFSFLFVVLFVLSFSLSVTHAETVTIGSGDVVYRDMDIILVPALWLVGHAGIYVGGNQVIHMQSSGCVKADFSTAFNNGYWGSFYAGGSYAADQRVKEANRLFNCCIFGVVVEIGFPVWKSDFHGGILSCKKTAKQKGAKHPAGCLAPFCFALNSYFRTTT